MDGADVIENGGGSGKLFLSKVVSDIRFHSLIIRTEQPLIPVAVLSENGLVLRLPYFFIICYTLKPIIFKYNF